MASRSQSLQRYWEHRRALWEVSPSEIRDAQKHGVVSTSLKRHAVEAQAETLSLVAALGGLDTLSEQRLILIQDAGRLGLIVRALTTQFLQGGGDPDLATRIATITTARRTLLQTLGLNRAEHEVPDLATYLRDKDAQKPEGDAIVEAHVADSVEFEITSESAGPRADGGGAAKGLSGSARSRAVANDSPEPGST